MLRLYNNLKGLYKYRVLIQNLVSRELKARYRGTVLGFLWSFVNPFLLMVIYTIVREIRLLETAPGYMLFISSAVSSPGHGFPRRP